MLVTARVEAWSTAALTRGVVPKDAGKKWDKAAGEAKEISCSGVVHLILTTANTLRGDTRQEAPILCRCQRGLRLAVSLIQIHRTIGECLRRTRLMFRGRIL